MKVLIQLTAQSVYCGKSVEAGQEIEIDEKDYDLFKNISRMIGPVQDPAIKSRVNNKEDKSNG